MSGMKIKTEAIEDDKEAVDFSQANDYGFQEYYEKDEKKVEIREFEEVNQPIGNTEPSSR